MNGVQESNRKSAGQSMVEFMLALPILLLLIFGVIEMARLVQAWLAVENAARFGARSAVTGEFNTAYCEAANLALGWAPATYDGYNGDPIDCVVPRAADPVNYNERTSTLVDWARLPSIRDAAIAGMAGTMVDESVGSSEAGFLEIVICSYPSNLTPENLESAPATVPVCNPVDDPGDPGNPVRVIVFYNHPLIVPILGPTWPHLSLVGAREMIVETFRTPRALGAPMALVTATIAPSITPTPYPTETPFGGIPPTATPSPTTFNPCVDIFTSGFNVSGQQISWLITNAGSTSITMTGLYLDWPEDPNVSLDLIKLGGNDVWDQADNHPPTTVSTSWKGGVSREIGAGGSSMLLFQFQAAAAQGPYTLEITFDNGCLLTPSAIPAPHTPTPTLDPACIGLGFQGDWRLVMAGDNRMLEIDVTNQTGDDVTLDRAILFWENYHNYSLTQNVKEIRFDGEKIYRGHANWSPVSTGWGVDEDLNDGDTVILDVKFDEDDGPWSGTDYGPGDFGLVLQFTNGCTIQRPVTVHNRPTVTPTPLGAECTGLDYSSDWRLIMDDDKKTLEIDVSNTSGEDVRLQNAIFYWGNYDMYAPWQNVKVLEFDGDKIMDTPDFDSPTYSGGNENERLRDGDTVIFYVEYKVKDGPWSGTDYGPGDFGVRLEFDNGCSLFKPVTRTDRPTATPTPPIIPGPSGTIWYYCQMNPDVWLKVEWHTNPDGTVTTRATFSKTFVDNTYGANAIGWDDGHTFGQLVGSDHIQIEFKAMDGSTVFDAKFDYITGAGGCYASMGVSGGDGKLFIGDESHLTSIRVSLAENLCTLGCTGFTESSPITDDNYSPSPECPGWDYSVWYEITLDPAAFGSTGFGYPMVTNIHASPSKTGINTEPVGPGAPTPVHSPTPTPTEYICADC